MAQTGQDWVLNTRDYCSDSGDGASGGRGGEDLVTQKKDCSRTAAAIIQVDSSCPQAERFF